MLFPATPEGGTVMPLILTDEFRLWVETGDVWGSTSHWLSEFTLCLDQLVQINIQLFGDFCFMQCC